MGDYLIYPKQFRSSIIPVERNRCFFLMPFSKEFDTIYGSIKNMLSDEGYICNRADEISGSTPILNKILTEIMKSQYVIVDLTDNNPNVFYELGVSHTLKDAHNVLLLKQKHKKVPFDITHLTYLEYDPQNIKLLIARIRDFLEENKNINAFYDALNIRGVISFIDENTNEFIEYMQAKLEDQLQVTIKGLKGETQELNEQQVENLLNKFFEIIGELIRNRNHHMLPQVLRVFYEIILALVHFPQTQESVEFLLNDYYDQFNLSELEIRGWKTELALVLAKNNKLFSVVMPWIIYYFSRSKTATIDLNRYKIEDFLMTSNSTRVNDMIVHSLYDRDCYIREHMADIIGEKKLIQATMVLFSQLPKEENYYSAVSMMSAIGKLGDVEGMAIIERWIDANKSTIISTNQLFTIKHALIAINKLDNSKEKLHVNRFEQEFGKLIENYFIL